MLDGEGLIKTNDKCNVVRKYHVISLPPDAGNTTQISGFSDLTFIVVTTRVVDE